MILTFTDFGVRGPYLGEVEAALYRNQALGPCTHLMSDAPRFNPRASGYLLGALLKGLPASCVVLGVVDPGVGSEVRRPIAVNADGRWLVGPDNGLFARAALAAEDVHVWEILWRPGLLSSSFHGRDLFAPVAAMLSRGTTPEMRPVDSYVGMDWPREIAEVIYVDDYGNAFTGLEASRHPGKSVCVAGEVIPRVATFCSVPEGSGLCYENSCGLIELAVNQGAAASRYGLVVGSRITLCD